MVNISHLNMFNLNSLVSRRPLVLFIALGAMLFLFSVHTTGIAKLKVGTSGTSDQWTTTSPTVSHGTPLEELKKACAAPDPFEEKFGRANLRMTRAYEGSLFRTQTFVNKILRGEKVTVTTIGGSVTKGHGVDDGEKWIKRLEEWLRDFYPGVDLDVHNGAQPATGSDYFSFCFPLHIPEETDLVIIELAINDEGIPEHVTDMENLLRGVLDMPKRPAVMLVEILAFSNGGMGGGGGRMHLPVAQFFDVPVINHRHPLANHFDRFPHIMPLYFTTDFWGNTDMRHINARGHHDVALIIGSLLRDTSCELARDPNYVVQASSDKHELVENLPHKLFHQQLEAAYGDDMATQEQALKIMEQGWAGEQRSFIATPRRPKKENEDDEDPPEPEPVFFPGMWNRPPEYGVAPRQYVLDGWNDNVETRVPPWHPHCYSTRAVEPKFNLTMTDAKGFEWWVHNDFKDKPYIRGTKPGDSVTFEIETIVGTIKMYVLMSKTFGFGILQCQVSGKDDKVEIDTYWDKDPNIGRFATIAENLGPGKHTVKCEIMSETSDPEGRSEVRIISLMSV
ncbi:uncharacterized protein LOC62_03G004686 [Vanrija pseudolonga]|uniref:SGNH hydrolase-type esterase domain-containing protein n=1 Tax=Vanrija pseudolonga TaxID=143232 RepID=A0AAF0YAF1_9TREE|nr:hypothetical protein LOC62_03G004686 [Vanrija pseudolonga]